MANVNLTSWKVYHRGTFLGYVEADTKAQAVRKARREFRSPYVVPKFVSVQRNPSKRSVRKRVAKALKKFVRGNPARVKGRKVKGGRAVTVRNFTGTIVKRSDGTVDILGKGRR